MAAAPYGLDIVFATRRLGELFCGSLQTKHRLVVYRDNPWFRSTAMSLVRIVDGKLGAELPRAAEEVSGATATVLIRTSKSVDGIGSALRCLSLISGANSDNSGAW